MMSSGASWKANPITCRVSDHKDGLPKRDGSHLGRQLEGEAAVELRKRGRQVQAGQGLADAVPAALAEGHEPLRLAAVHQRNPFGILSPVLLWSCRLEGHMCNSLHSLHCITTRDEW